MLIRFSGITNVVMEVVDPALWRPIDIMYQDDDASFIREELGWTPKIPPYRKDHQGSIGLFIG